MTTYDTLPGTVEKIIDAAIESHMSNAQWEGDVTQGFKNWRGGTGDGYWHIAPPGNPRSAGGQVTDGDGKPVEFNDGTNVGRDIYGHWETTIRTVFEPWLSLPDPEAFDAATRTLADNAWEISVTTDGDNAVTKIGNPAMESLSYLREKGSTMSSEFWNDFMEKYAFPLPSVVHGQYEMLALASISVVGERLAWVNARSDVCELADNALKAMINARYAGGGGSWSSLLKTLGTIAGIAAVFPTPAKPILAGAGTILSGLATLIGTTEPPKPEPIKFGAQDPAACWEQVVEGLRQLNLAIIDQEAKLYEAINEALKYYADFPHAFDLKAPDLPTVPSGELRTDLIDVEPDDVKHIAKKTLPRIAGNLTAAAALDPAKTPHAWQREGLIGLTHQGFYPSWAELVANAEYLCSDTAYELLQSATALQAAIGEVEAADEESEAAARKVRDEVRAELDYVPPPGAPVDPVPPYGRP
ncbi:hypothetical protein [Nocardioides sp. GXZ039]|uniref:hypothetical protein n=1 Tax=Nocardioides sp. GXZ039 TaxID=3136018 RepID=UPI0030F38176